MAIFGTIGLFVSYIPLPSSLIALVRAVGGFLFLSVVLLIRRGRLDLVAIRKNLLWLSLSGAFLGFNWILLFEAYHHTSVAVGTLCYYMAPIIVVAVSPFILKERITLQKSICVLVALAGMILISGVLSGFISDISELTGILLGLAAAALYASIMLCNKKMVALPAYDRTLFQLGFSAIIMFVYCFATTDVFRSFSALDGRGWILLAVVAVIHTGVSYFLYFGSMEHLPAQSIAMISYIDPVIAIVCSVLLLAQTPTLGEAVGAVLILGAAICSELPFRKRVKA